MTDPIRLLRAENESDIIQYNMRNYALDEMCRNSNYCDDGKDDPDFCAGTRKVSPEK